MRVTWPETQSLWVHCRCKHLRARLGFSPRWSSARSPFSQHPKHPPCSQPGHQNDPDADHGNADADADHGNAGDADGTSMNPYCPLRLMFLNSPNPCMTKTFNPKHKSPLYLSAHKSWFILIQRCESDLEEALDVPLPTVVPKIAEEEPATVVFLILIKLIGFGNWQPINHQQP